MKKIVYHIYIPIQNVNFQKQNKKNKKIKTIHLSHCPIQRIFHNNYISFVTIGQIKSISISTNTIVLTACENTFYPRDDSD